MKYLDIKETIKIMAEDNYKEFVKALISFDIHQENEEVLDAMYEEFMEEDHMTLLNEELLELEDRALRQKEIRLVL